MAKNIYYDDEESDEESNDEELAKREEESRPQNQAFRFNPPEETKEEEVVVPTDKKKHKVLLTFTIILSILGLLIGTFYGLFYVNDKRVISLYENEVTNKEVIESTISRGVDNTKETKIVNFNVEEIVINSIIHSALDLENNPSLNQFIENVYVHMKDENKMWIVANFKLLFFKTQIKIALEVDKITEGNEDEWYLKLKLNSIVLGRVPSLEDTIIKIMLDKKVDEMINSILTSQKLNLKVDFGKKEIRYFYKDIVNDIKTIFGESKESMTESEIGLYTQIISELFYSDLFSFESKESEFFNLLFDVEGFTHKGVEDSRKKVDVDNGVKKIIEKLYGKNKEINNKETLAALTYFLFHGYSRLSLTDKEKIDLLDFSDIEEIPNFKEFEGFNEFRYGRNIEAIINEQLTPNSQYNIQSNNEFVLLTAAQIADSVRNRTYFLGYGNIFSRIEDDKLIYNYLVTTDFYCKMESNQIKFYIVFSINGCDCNIIFTTKVIQEDFKLRFEITKIELGDYIINNTLYDIFLDVLGKSLTDTDNIISVIHSGEETKGEFVFDFSGIRDNENVGQVIRAKENTSNINFVINNDRISFAFQPKEISPN